MARTRNPIVVLDNAGKPLAGASVQTNARAGGAASCFTTEAGATAAANPATTDAQGKIVQWLDRGAYSSVISSASFTTYTEYWDSAPGSDGSIEEAWLVAALKTSIAAIAALEPGAWANPESSSALVAESTVQTRKEGGTVRFKGQFKAASNIPATGEPELFKLSSAYRPTTERHLPILNASTSGSARITVRTSGVVIFVGNVQGAGSVLSLDGISYVL